MAKRWTDYDGPTGAFVVTHGVVRPLSEPDAMEDLSRAALLAGLGSTDAAIRYQTLTARRQPAAA